MIPDVGLSVGSTRTRKETDADAQQFPVPTYIAEDVDVFGRAVQRENSRNVHAHTETLMLTGFIVNSYYHLRKLVNVIDGIEDHLHAREKGTLHRDISSANLSILPDTTWDSEETVGRLMDLDHAFFTDKSIPIPTRESMDSDMSAMKIRELKKYFNVTVTHDVVAEAHRFSTFTEAYIWQAAGAPVINTSELVTISCLGWDQSETPEWPNFSGRRARQGERMGTLPFMSAEVLSRHFINYKGYDRQEFHHNAVHDLESFFWVLVHICLTRRGPASGMVQEELKPDSKGNLLRRIVNEYFESEASIIKETKRQLFMNSRPEKEFTQFSCQIYFESLKPLVRKWWTTLVLAYRYHGNEYYHIHSHILRLLRDALPSMPASDQK